MVHVKAILRAITLLALAGGTGGCLESMAIATGIGVAAVPLVGRTVPDILVSGLSGKDCSLVRLDAGKSYCAPEEPPPVKPVVCTRSLGTVDCWRNPEALGAAYTEVADGARGLTPAQEAHRTRRWPSLW